jgi:hypothetical protein
LHTKNGTELLGKDEIVYGNHTQQGILDISKSILEEWATWYGRTQPQDRQVYVNSFCGTKRTRLVESMNKTEIQGSLPTQMAGFVKCDKYFQDVALAKPPRMIQFAPPAVNVELAQHLGPAEHAYLLGRGAGPTGLPDCSKGMNNLQKADTWMRKRAAFSKPACLLGDFSKFDSHVHTHVLSLEHHFWKTVTHIDHRHLDRQLINDVAASGMRWRAVGTRMSGTYNTGGGNSVINIMIMRTIAKLTGITIETLCDGDDSLVFMQDEDVDTFAKCCSVVIPRVFGMKWEFSVSLYEHQEEYCHSAVSYRPDGTPGLIVDPVRALARAAAVVNKFGSELLGRQLVASMVGLYCSFPNHPVISVVSYKILRQLGAVRDDGLITARLILPENEFLKEQFLNNTKDYRNQDLTITLPPSFRTIDEGTRVDVARCFNLPVTEQLMLEESFIDELIINPSIKIKAARAVGTVLKERVELLPTSDYLTGTNLF